MSDTKMAVKQQQGESWGELAKTVVYAGLIAIVIRTFFFQPFNIPSASMENTLLVGDYLFVEKFSYGYSRYTFPFGGWPFGDRMSGRYFAHEPPAATSSCSSSRRTIPPTSSSADPHGGQ